jgi:hypothetical protein
MDMYESLSAQMNTIMTCMATTRRNIDLYADMYYQTGGEYSRQLNRMNNNHANSHNRTTNQTPNPTSINTNPRTDQSLAHQIISRFFTPVPVRPTQEQISTSTRTGVYSDIQNPINTSCSICQSEFQHIDNVIQIRSCGHIFHREELVSWFQTGGLGNGSVYCPMCRVDIREPLPLPTSVTDTTSSEEREEPEDTPLTDADRVTQFLSSIISSAGGDMNNSRIEYDASNNQFLILESEVIFRNPNHNRTNDDL